MYSPESIHSPRPQSSFGEGGGRLVTVRVTFGRGRRHLTPFITVLSFGEKITFPPGRTGCCLPVTHTSGLEIGGS